MERLRDDMEKAKNDAEKKRKELEEKITELQNELDKIRNYDDNINKQIERKNEEIGVYETRLKDATDALRKLLRQNTDLRGLNEKLRENLTEIQTNINKIQPDIHNEPEILTFPYEPEKEPKEGGSRMRSLDELLTYSVQIPADF
jgi:chromosome segregation ATPase